MADRTYTGDQIRELAGYFVDEELTDRSFEQADAESLKEGLGEIDIDVSNLENILKTAIRLETFFIGQVDSLDPEMREKITAEAMRLAGLNLSGDHQDFSIIAKIGNDVELVPKMWEAYSDLVRTEIANRERPSGIGFSVGQRRAFSEKPNTHTRRQS